jgi:hypothetical protein
MGADRSGSVSTIGLDFLPKPNDEHDLEQQGQFHSSQHAADSGTQKRPLAARTAAVVFRKRIRFSRLFV